MKQKPSQLVSVVSEVSEVSDPPLSPYTHVLLYLSQQRRGGL
jgi:hypothetical protein